MKTIILNSSNIVQNSGNGTFSYQFPSGNINLEAGQKLALASVQTYYSNFNISAEYNNNHFRYKWLTSWYTVDLPDSFMTVEDLNNYLHFQMMKNTHYVVNSDGEPVYLTNISTNPARYAVQIDFFPLSAQIAAANGWTVPPGATWGNPITANATYAHIEIQGNDFGKLIGFEPGQYPDPPAFANVVPAESVISTFSPQITPVSSFVMTCSLIKNDYATPNNLLYSYVPKSSYGEQYDITPSQYAFVDVQPGQYSSFQVQILDQDLRRVVFQDPSTVILLMISDVSDVVLK